ncbi:MAG TPA: sigma-70 family RNA polymerase sigma factor [Fimbriimonadaceae bacterium]|nr:sigma-70 family RNA polymerase sigma factor [Fimbriimonadaceae bacterium]
MITSTVWDPIESTSPRSAASEREFTSLIESTRRRAYTMAMQLTRNSAEAEDLMQETLVKAWKGYDSYMPGRPFLNWLLRIMQRAYLDSRRRENPIRKAESLNAMVSPSDGEVQELPIADPNAGPEAEALYAEFSAELRNALEDLPEVYRVAIVLCDLEELSYAEIADRQNTTIGTVRSRIHRGRKLLRDVVQKRGLDIPDWF